jgi:hypothetical protein
MKNTLLPFSRLLRGQMTVLHAWFHGGPNNTALRPKANHNCASEQTRETRAAAPAVKLCMMSSVRECAQQPTNTMTGVPPPITTAELDFCTWLYYISTPIRDKRESRKPCLRLLLPINKWHSAVAWPARSPSQGHGLIMNCRAPRPVWSLTDFFFFNFQGIPHFRGTQTFMPVACKQAIYPNSPYPINNLQRYCSKIREHFRNRNLPER